MLLKAFKAAASSNCPFLLWRVSWDSEDKRWAGTAGADIDQCALQGHPGVKNIQLPFKTFNYFQSRSWQEGWQFLYEAQLKLAHLETWPWPTLLQILAKCRQQHRADEKLTRSFSDSCPHWTTAGGERGSHVWFQRGSFLFFGKVQPEFTPTLSQGLVEKDPRAHQLKANCILVMWHPSLISVNQFCLPYSLLILFIIHLLSEQKRSAFNLLCLKIFVSLLLLFFLFFYSHHTREWGRFANLCLKVAANLQLQPSSVVWNNITPCM